MKMGSASCTACSKKMAVATFTSLDFEDGQDYYICEPGRRTVHKTCDVLTMFFDAVQGCCVGNCAGFMCSKCIGNVLA
jgi:hypothetical protein